MVVLTHLLPAVGVAIADPGSVGRQQRQQAEGWLQLKQDQTAYREGVEPLAPREATGLDRLERRQLGDARALERRQQQSLDSDRNRRHKAPTKRPVAHPREHENKRQLDRQRLDMRIQRETLRPGFR